jgi:hypothetical protein
MKAYWGSGVITPRILNFGTAVLCTLFRCFVIPLSFQFQSTEQERPSASSLCQSFLQLPPLHDSAAILITLLTMIEIAAFAYQEAGRKQQIKRTESERLLFQFGLHLYLQQLQIYC